jgi:hypothetical protein
MDNTIAIRLKSLEEHVNELEKRIEKLWQQWIPFQTEGEKRVVAAAQNIGLRRSASSFITERSSKNEQILFLCFFLVFSFKMKRVPEGYYSWTLEKRR